MQVFRNAVRWDRAVPDRRETMAVTTTRSRPKLLTYEQYLAEPVLHRRYDIVDGERRFMPGPSWRHQRIQRNATRILERYEEETGSGYVIGAPFDILIRRSPRLRTRQPDVLFITRSRLAQGGGIPASGPLEVAPELVVEIISDSETENLLQAKLADYVAIGVNEAWVVRPDTRIVEVVRLAPEGPRTVATYDETEALQSITFADLTVPVADFFGD
jgi:Uma2 family endonuclease